MSNETQKDLESFSEAARRLLCRLDERTKNRPAAEMAAKIEGSPEEWSLVPGERGEEAAPGKAAAPSPVIVCHGVRLGVSGQTNVVRIYAAANDEFGLWDW